MLQRFKAMTGLTHATHQFLTLKPAHLHEAAGESVATNDPNALRDQLLSVENNIVVTMALIAIATGGLFYLGHPATMIVAWAVIALALAVAGYGICRKARNLEGKTVSLEKWSIQITAALWLVSGGWALLAWFPCDSCSAVAFPFFKGAMVLVSLTSLTLSAALIRHATWHVFAPSILTFSIAAFLEKRPADVAFATILALVVVFIAFIQSKLHENARALHEAEREKDAVNQALAFSIKQTETAAGAARTANRSKAAFLAAMSHDLRTPLNAIIGFSEVMKDEMMGPVGNAHYASYVDDIHRSGRHLLDMIDGVLDLSRLEAGGYSLHEQTIYLADIVEASIAMVRPEAERHSIRIFHEHDHNMAPLLADERALKQILVNLLSNAIKFSPDNTEIVIGSGWTENGGQLLCVRDYGSGMDHDTLENATIAFQRGTDAHQTEGVGLGLSIVHQLALAHEAELMLESEPGKGTLAVVSFPMKRVAPCPADMLEDSKTGLKMPVRPAETLPFEADSLEIEASDLSLEATPDTATESLVSQASQWHHSGANDDSTDALALDALIEAEIVAAFDTEARERAREAANAA